MAKDENSLSGLEERLIKLIEAQAELLNKFISETERRLGELEGVTNDLVSKVDDLDSNKQDVPAPYELKYQEEQEEAKKAEREEKDELIAEKHDELVSRVDSLESIVTPYGESLDTAVQRVSDSLTELDEFVRSRLK
jgi:DNA anti-recombination protein RmuC